MHSSTETSELYSKQVALVLVVYKFRFVTAGLVADYLGLKSAASIRVRLAQLVELGYVTRSFNARDRMNGRHALYYLTPACRDLLRRHGVAEVGIQGLYKNPRLSRSFQERCINVLALTVRLQQTHDNAVTVYTRNDLASANHMPHPLPDGLVISTDPAGTTRYHFLEVLDEQLPRFALRRRISTYDEYITSGEWQDATHLLPPIVLFVCRSEKHQKAVHIVLDRLEAAAAITSQFEITVIDT